ncbi:MAG: hypothetical protein ACREQE_02615, partial [Candidatus Binataceae bacterium]
VRARKSRAPAYWIAIAIAVLIAVFLLRRAMEPASVRYIVPPHQRPATVYPEAPEKPPGMIGNTSHNGAAAGQDGAALSPSHPDGTSSAENLTPEERRALEALIQRKTAH